MARRKFKDRTVAGKVRCVIFRILLALFGLAVIALLVVGIWFYNAYGEHFLELRDMAKVTVSGVTAEKFRSTESSICYFADGTVMQELKNEKNSYYIEYDRIPQDVVNSMLATEDRKFFSHSGYDIYAIVRAAVAYLENDGEIRQGGSTITQQLARGVFLTNEKTVERKVSEIFLAAELEKRFSKEQILEFYLNTIYFANGYYGIQTASVGYFGTGVGNLSLSQIAYLCGIPNSPSLYDPRKHPDKTIERRDSVLLQMFENGFIDSEAYDKARNEKIVLKDTPRFSYDYEETFAYNCAVKALMSAEGFVFRNSFVNEEDKAFYEEAYDESYYRVRRDLYLKGYRIYTSLNPAKQEMLQMAIDEETASFTEMTDDGVYKLQAAGTCIDNETGFVVAIVGGRSDDTVGYTLNRAYQSPRQPGSSIKPLIVYTPLFELGYYPDDPVVDERFQGGPRNSGGVYSGEIDIRYAVSASKNTVAWKLFCENGIDKGLSYLKKMGFEHIVESDYVPAASLGGLTYGTTTVEMASGYAAIENQGVFRTPTCILKITDAKGNAVIDNTGSAVISGGKVAQKTSRVYDKNAALIMTDCLKTVMKTGTGRKLRLSNITCAGKTGTTNDQKDGWFVGFTSYYTTAVWVGCDRPKKIEDLMGNTYPERIWHSYMEMIHSGLEDVEFEEFYDPREPEEVEDEQDEEGETEYGEKMITDAEGFFVADGDLVIEGGFETELYEETVANEDGAAAGEEGTAESEEGNAESEGGTAESEDGAAASEDETESFEQDFFTAEDTGMWYDPGEISNGQAWNDPRAE
ncbi:MAG: transglycosylase domain-containing protein [Lachnospiraceae bacterium]|nr:transglycosylase domain-containing protein [Lachnospiraceae bacterium]